MRLDKFTLRGQEAIQSAIELAIDRLPTSYRSVFVLRELEGMSVAETAECLSITPESVKTRVAGIQNERRRTYAAMLLSMDDAIGKVLQKDAWLHKSRDRLKPEAADGLDLLVDFAQLRNAIVKKTHSL